jgi:hypothetical protein
VKSPVGRSGKNLVKSVKSRMFMDGMEAQSVTAAVGETSVVFGSAR